MSPRPHPIATITIITLVIGIVGFLGVSLVVAVIRLGEAWAQGIMPQ